MHLQSLTITNFRKFGLTNNRLEFVKSESGTKRNISNATTLIVGKNNVGKTTIIDAFSEIAQTLGISTENPELNPYWNKVTSVKNLVLFLHNQPKTKVA